jgi:16S rRNA (cytosine1402-N4)-methyltransferase
LSNAYHIPVLLSESVDGLNIKPDGVYVDVTFGGGGHSREILKRLTTGKLIGFDQDEAAAQNIINDKRFIFVNHNFRFIKNFLRYHGHPQVDGILADLGVSSHHFDDAQRGFSFRFDAPLDMRMDRDKPLTAETVVNTWSLDELTQIFREYGEIENARKLAITLVQAREAGAITTTGELAKAVEKCTPRHVENKYLAKLFQALRIEVNQEMEVLKQFLEQTPGLLKKEGRLVVITYHSLEDRLVKNFMKKGKFEGELEKDFYGNPLVPFELVNNKIIVASEEEIERNNRARSAKLRIAEKI